MTEAEVILNTLMFLFNEQKLDVYAINEILSIIVPHSAITEWGTFLRLFHWLFITEYRSIVTMVFLRTKRVVITN